MLCSGVHLWYTVTRIPSSCPMLSPNNLQSRCVFFKHQSQSLWPIHIYQISLNAWLIEQLLTDHPIKWTVEKQNFFIFFASVRSMEPDRHRSGRWCQENTGCLRSLARWELSPLEKAVLRQRAAALERGEEQAKEPVCNLTSILFFFVVFLRVTGRLSQFVRPVTD